MKKVFLDTNIVLDLLAKREPFYPAVAQLFSLSDKAKIQLYVSSLSFPNLNYILLKGNKPEEVKLILRRLKLLTKVLDLDDKIISLSLNDKDFRDFEDAIQYYSALENDCDVIITRNLKDFTKSKIPVFTADQFLKHQ